MAIIKPFAAVRPRAELAAQICELPYDVVSSQEAREIVVGNPLSFLHVSKPEIDLPATTDPRSPEVYSRGRENFYKLISEGALIQDSKPSFYLYRQVMGKHQQTGLVAVASCEDYLRNIIKKHELTRMDKEEDRLHHIEELNSQTGPVFLAYPGKPLLGQIIAAKTAEAPAVDFIAREGIRHSAWVINDRPTLESIEAEFARVPALYIADGHHRSAAAVRVWQKRRGAGESAYFLAVLFPHSHLQILPYHRVLKDLNQNTPAQLLDKLSAIFVLSPNGAPQPERKHEIGLYVAGQWHTMRFRPQFSNTNTPIETLDVSLLQKYVLTPLFGIEDARTSTRINFIGGIRGTAELEKVVDQGEYACAFSLFPPGMEDLMGIADAGGIMPPKSTWFEPKLRDGMFCHLI